MKIAVYDLDRTVTRRPTYTPFLIHAARRIAPWRLALLPAWIMAMIGYKAGLIERGRLKSLGFRLLVGARVNRLRLEEAGREFAAATCVANVRADARRRISEDRADGAMLVLATAANQVYAAPLAAELGFDAVLATRQQTDRNDYRCDIDGDNCYGPSKLERLRDWLAATGRERADVHIILYSDHVSDGPALDWADHGVLVNAGARASRIAQARSWGVERFG